MTIQEQDWTSEQGRLKEVRLRIDQEIERLQAIVHQRQSEVITMRQNFWDDVTVNTANDDDLAETAASITQQQAVLSQEERSYRHAEQSLRKLTKLYQSPYFARIDFTESGMIEAEPIYIGIGSVINEDTHELLVYDWRAPVSGMFYDYTPGPAQYRSPEGVIEGEMTLKRQYIIKHGNLENMFDTGMNIGDEMLQLMLAKNAHEKMSSIVMTIQQEQNQIIRDDQHEVLIVQGAAGSGKTSVALQRVAYLLYKYRNSLSAENMLLFSPNSLFNDYISNVLPELGEVNLRQTTFQAHLVRGFTDEFKVEDGYDQLEYLLTAPESDPDCRVRVQGIEWKTSRTFIEVLNSYIDYLKKDGILFHPFVLHEKVLISSGKLAEWFYHSYKMDQSISNRLDKMKDKIFQELDRWEQKLFQQFFQKMLRSPKYLGTDKEMKDDSRRKARKAFASLKERAKKLTFIDEMGMYRRLFTDARLLKKITGGLEVPENYAEIGQYTLQRLTAQHIPYEDATPLLYLKSAILGMQTLNRMKQVVIDEAQDYSPFQLEYLRRLFPRARFTLLGDLNQGIYYANVQSYQMMEELFGTTDVAIYRMEKSYRSTEEIVEFTKRILYNPEPIQPISRSGETPKVVGVPAADQLVKEISEQIEDMLQQGVQSLAIICKTHEEARIAFERLKEATKSEIHLLTKNTRSFVGGVVILPAYLAKGLEFDGVIVYDASVTNYHRDAERKLLYTACTRAMHQLIVYYTGELTSFLQRSEKNLQF
jgi:DNA helicase II / ATP-dependent DNA helicase PcrA